MFSPKKMPLVAAKYRWLIFVGMLVSMTVGSLFSIATAYADVPAATTVEAPVQQSAAASSSVASTQPANIEAATPFLQKSNPQLNAAKTPPKVGSGAHLLNVTLGLIAIIALIYVLSQFVKRFGSGSFSNNSQLKILSSMPLGTRERIVLIDAGGQQLLLGITPTSINTLHVFADPIVIDNKPEVQSDFSRKLMAILQQKTSGTSSDNKNNSAAQE